MQVYPPLPEPTSYRHLLALRKQVFEARITAGEIRPVIYPFDFFSAYLLITALCIPLPRNSSGSGRSRWSLRTVTRYVIAIVISGLYLDTLLHARVRVLANGYIVGLAAVWSIVWVLMMFVFRDAQAEFRRVVRVSPSSGIDSSTSSLKSVQESSITESHTNGNGNAGLRQRKAQPGTDLAASVTSEDVIRGEWESYPAKGTLMQRYLWANDLMTNFRGLGWNWVTPRLHSSPIRKEWELGTAKDGDILLTKAEEQAFKQRRIIRSFWQFAVCYLLIDALKVAMMMDPYFWGLVDSPSPAYLPSLIRESWLLTKTYRLLFTMSGAFLALRYVFAGTQFLFLSTFHALDIGHLSEVWLNVPYNGSLDAIFDKGLAGFWGRWWHQLFRFGFSSAGRYICELLGWDDNLRSEKAMLVQSFTAFFISACFHAAGSYTMDAPTNPWQPFAFFIFQFVGIVLQRYISKLLITASARERLPLLLKRTGNTLFVIGWLWLTGPLFGDDAAKGGVWLFEPIPISPIRGLGFGAKGEGWIPVSGEFLGLYRDPKYWWRSGIRIN